MKYFYITPLVLAAGFVMTAQAAPVQRRAAVPDYNHYKAFFKAPLKSAPVDMEIIYDTPEGEESLLASNSDAFTVEGLEATHSRVYGSAVKMVTDGDNVFFSHIVAEYPIDT